MKNHGRGWAWFGAAGLGMAGQGGAGKTCAILCR